MSLRDQAYTEIRQRIVSLGLPPGSTIDETQLRQELDLGRTPIREALLRLSEEGLVTIIPRRGMFVSDIGVKDLRQLFEIRVVLEPLAVRLAGQRGTAQHWAQMEEALSSLPDAGSPLENEQMIKIDELCHTVIYDAANNVHLTTTLSSLYALSLRLWYYFLKEIGSMRGAIMEHRSMLKALQAGEIDQAAELMERHITVFQEEIQAAMVGQSLQK
jgi:DNA-binding GntR family transcriptional regulator